MPRPMRRLLAAACIAVLLAGCGGRSKPKFASPPKSGLASHLEKPPKFSVPGNSRWARDYSPSVSDFVGHFYADKVQGRIKRSLDGQGIQDVAHVLWITDDRIQSDLVLLRFADAAGARERVAFSRKVTADNRTLSTYTMTAPGSPVVYYSTESDTQGYVGAKTYVAVGDIAVEMFVNSPADQVPRPLMTRWLRAQLALLP